MNDYDRIARIIRFLREHQAEQPALATLGQFAGLSPYHLHRLFSRWAGITPKDFLQCLTLDRAKRLLMDGKSVLDAALDVGLSGPSRLHDLCVSLEAASPGELKAGGASWSLRTGFLDSPFGVCLAAEGPRGICHLSFVESKSRRRGESEIRMQWPQADFVWDDEGMMRRILPLFIKRAGRDPVHIRALVRGSAFQVRVWKALLRVPYGALVSYGQIAQTLGSPGAARAVGTAVGRNPLAYLIPCHRVIRESGCWGAYRWGSERKQAMLVREAAGRD